MRSVRTSLSLALLGALLLPGLARAERPGRHAHYLHALSDLHAAERTLEQRRRGEEPQWFERKALDELDAAIDGLEEAAFRVGKDIYELPPVDMRTRARGRLPTVLALLRRAYDAAGEDEDDGRARALRRRALAHVDRAIQLVEDGMEGRESAPPPDESVSEDDWEEGSPADEEEQALYEDAPDPDARAVYLEPPVEAPPPVAVRYLPPPMRYEPPPPIPEDGMHWVGGYWVWDDGEWVWMSGHWVRPPRPEYLWVAPYYEVRGPVVVFVTGHWGPPGYVFRPPPPAVQIRVVEARPAYRGTLVVRSRVTVGSFVPAPPGSRLGIIVPAPIGTPPQVVVGAPPVVRPGMVIRPVEGRTTVIHNTTVINNVTIVAPAGCTKSGQAVRAVVPGRPALAASLPPRAAVAPPPPPPAAVHAHPGFFSPVAVRPPQPGQRQPLPPTVTPHPTDNTLRVRPGRTERAPFGQPPAGRPPAGNPPPPAGQPATPPPGGDDRRDRPRGPRDWSHDDGRRDEDRPRGEPARTEPGHAPPPGSAAPGNAAQPPPPGNDRRDERGPRGGWGHDDRRRDDAGPPRTDPARTEPGHTAPPANNPPPALPAQPPPPARGDGGPARHEPPKGEPPRSEPQHPATAPARTEPQRPGGPSRDEHHTNATPPPRQEPQHQTPPPQSQPPAQNGAQPPAGRPQGGGASPARDGAGPQRHFGAQGQGGAAPRGRAEHDQDRDQRK